MNAKHLSLIAVFCTLSLGGVLAVSRLMPRPPVPVEDARALDSPSSVTTDSPPVALDDGVIRNLSGALELDGGSLEDFPLELEIAAGYSGGYAYFFGFATEPVERSGHVSVRGRGWELLVFEPDLPNLRGTLIRYDDTGAGFRFDNPNVVTTDGEAILSFRHPQPRPRIRLIGPRGQYGPNRE